MTKFENNEKIFLFDFFKNEQQLLIKLANSLTKNILHKDIKTSEDALNILCLHGGGVHSILNKKSITKEVLFKYLHNSKVPVTNEITKPNLIQKIYEYWKKNVYELNSLNVPVEINEENIKNEESIITISNQNSMVQLMHNEIPLQTQTQIHNHYFLNNLHRQRLQDQEESFPVHMLAAQFSEWFFNSLNRNNLKIEDFWKDSILNMRLLDNGNTNDFEASKSQNILEMLNEVKLNYGFIFNPNTSHQGCQGRIDRHGLTLVITCGSLHNTSEFIGIFETVFGLIRDPNVENNWKVKQMKIFLKSSTKQNMPSLSDTETLKDALCLPVSDCEIN